MYAEAGERHSSPHFHARFSGHRATFSVETGDVLSGSLPIPQMRLVQAWVELHRAELEGDWKLLTTGHSPSKIAPLA